LESSITFASTIPTMVGRLLCNCHTKVTLLCIILDCVTLRSVKTARLLGRGLPCRLEPKPFPPCPGGYACPKRGNDTFPALAAHDQALRCSACSRCWHSPRRLDAQRNHKPDSDRCVPWVYAAACSAGRSAIQQIETNRHTCVRIGLSAWN
jgi:hypothetical protein